MDRLSLAPLTCAMTKAGLAAGIGASLTQTLMGGATANILTIRGKMYLVAALANTTTPITDYATGKGFLPVMANQGSTFLIGFNAAGQLKAVQGTINPLDVNGNFLTAPQFGGLGPAGSQTGPGSGTDFCPIGYLIIQCGATANASNGWVFGLNSMSGAVGITYTFQDVCGITDRPQIN